MANEKVYKPYLISTVVDPNASVKTIFVYKPYLISTVVDKRVPVVITQFINLI